MRYVDPEGNPCLLPQEKRVPYTSVAPKRKPSLGLLSFSSSGLGFKVWDLSGLG